MSRFKIVLGDWSDDGHGKTQEYTIAVPDEFTDDILSENYKRNVELLGIDPREFAEEYEDSSLPADVAKKLRELGVTAGWEGMEDDDAYIEPEGMLNIIMFLFGYGFDGFVWELEETPILIGNFGAKATGNDNVGYGLFY